MPVRSPLRGSPGARARVCVRECVFAGTGAGKFKLNVLLAPLAGAAAEAAQLLWAKCPAVPCALGAAAVPRPCARARRRCLGSRGREPAARAGLSPRHLQRRSLLGLPAWRSQQGTWHFPARLRPRHGPRGLRAARGLSFLGAIVICQTLPPPGAARGGCSHPPRWRGHRWPRVSERGGEDPLAVVFPHLVEHRGSD